MELLRECGFVSVCVRLCVTVGVLLVYRQQTEECIDRLAHSLDNQQQQSVSASGNALPLFIRFPLKHPLLSTTSQNLLWALNNACPPEHLLVLGGGLPLGTALEEKVAA